MTKLSDQWQTPVELFSWLDKGGVYQGMELEEGFNFDIDLCAIKENSKCNQFYIDYLKNIKLDFTGWNEERRPLKHKYNCAFMNPPYSNPRPFIEKAWDDSKYCKIVCLVKCDPSTRWWATFWDYTPKQLTIMVNEPDFGIGRECKTIYIKPSPKPGCEVHFFPKRIKFDPPQQLIDSGEIYDLNSSTDALRALSETLKDMGKYKPRWVSKCTTCEGTGELWAGRAYSCDKCDSKGYKELTGPTFSSALLIFDRRGS